jgi:Subtilase family
MSTLPTQADELAWSQAMMYWLENQVAIAFHSSIPLYSDPDPAKSKGAIVESLRLDALNRFLNARGFNLVPFDASDTTDNPTEANVTPGTQPANNINNLPGKYFFPALADQGTIVVAFFQLSRVDLPHPMQDLVAMYGPIGIHDFEASLMRLVVNLINNNLDKLRREGRIPIVAAMPNWLSGATPCGYHNGCWVPIKGKPPAPGSWHITLPDLTAAVSPLRDMEGDGVTVFVLDTMPKVGPEEASNAILQAVARAGDNELLREIATQMNRSEAPYVKFDYQVLPDHLAEDAPDTLKTGRDVYGRLVGFCMPDHGLFVTGIVRDLAPAANIECIRVLNDFGVGDTQTLIAALSGIQDRRAKGGDLYNKPVVVNLSLVVTPPDEKLPQLWFGNNFIKASEFTQMAGDMQKLRSPLHLVIQSLVGSGMVIVAAAGNDSHPLEAPRRVGPAYPAAFPEVISVGAVVEEGSAAEYSNYPVLPPNHNGIATYGGALPQPVPAKPDPNKQTKASAPDSLRGLYSSPDFPSLSMDDPPVQGDIVPDNQAWTHWSGTSFAAPIISAVAARILESVHQKSAVPSHLRAAEVQWAITTAEGQQVMLTGTAPLDLQPEFGVGTLRAVQEVQQRKEMVV